MTNFLSLASHSTAETGWLVRERRLAHEMQLLEQTAAANPESVRILRSESSATLVSLFVSLEETDALVWAAGKVTVRRQHGLTIRYGRFFPAVPMELSLADPVIHPNVDPDDGWICLWAEHDPRRTCVHALQQAQRILTWQIESPQERHLLQPDAVRQRLEFPGSLTCQSLVTPFAGIVEGSRTNGAHPRRRIEPPDEQAMS